jgi:phage minor structural protein
MPKAPIIIYDKDMKKQAYLENAFAIGYEFTMNGLWSAEFYLPADDPKNAECLPLRYVEIFDNNERIELFRILPMSVNRTSNGRIVRYRCEHVLATLLDDVLFQYHTIGNLGVYTRDVLQYILSKQSVQRWVIDDVEFSRQFEYNWENETLLGALWSVSRPFVEEFLWTWDTTTFPWKLSLKTPPDGVQAYIKYGVNMTGITKEVDPSNLFTRLYGLGAGEGVNQLTIKDANGGVPYIQDNAAIAKYGLITRIFADSRFQYADTLYARCQTLLNQSKEPRVSYQTTATDIHRLTGQKIHRFDVGSIIRVQDKEMGEDFRARLVKVSKSDILGNPGEVSLEIANKSQDISGTIADLANRARINEVYAQGATNFDSHNFADNADPTHPATLKFWIPEETARINKVMLSYQCEAFRAYSKAIEGGGAVQTTTESGGGTQTTTESGGSSTPTTNTNPTTVQSATTSKNWRQYAIDVIEAVDFAGSHNHGIPNGTQLAKAGGGFVTFSESGGHSHSLTSDHTHDVTIPSHNHIVTIPNHTHGIQLPNHTHSISIPSHTHEIEYGIYEGPTPTQLNIKVDGTTIPVTDTQGDIDIIPYLSKDGAGKIQRGAWHTIEIAPNTLGRIVASVLNQIFVQSRGGGDY